MQQMITTQLDLTMVFCIYVLYAKVDRSSYTYVKCAILIQMTLIRITIYYANKQNYE